MLGALRLLPQFRLLIGQQGCRGMGCRPIGLLRAIYVREWRTQCAFRIKFIHTTTLRVIAMHARFLFWISVVC